MIQSSLLMVVSALFGAANAVVLQELDQPVEISLLTHDKQPLMGDITGFDTERFSFRSREGDSRDVAWGVLSPKTIFATYQQLMDRSDGHAWLELGQLLGGVDGGVSFADKALQVAVALDEMLAEDAQRIRDSAPVELESPDPAIAVVDSDSHDAAVAASVVLEIEGQYAWAPLDADDRAVFIQKEKDFATRIAEKMKVNFHAVETEYFLFFTTIAPDKNRISPFILDQMYDKSMELFGVPRGTVLFRGKAVVFLFDSMEQLNEYGGLVKANTNVAGTCQYYSTGEVRIYLFQTKRTHDTMHTMLHETAHGVTYAYRAPVHFVTWLTEGIAEWVASDTSGYYLRTKQRKREARNHLRKNSVVNPKLFTDQHVPGHDYGTALALVEILLKEDPEKFKDFIREIKDGIPWEESLANEYEMAVDELIERYGRSIGAALKRP